ncbi:unnamed protein product, partial [Didymodactylos carnosus]
ATIIDHNPEESDYFEGDILLDPGMETRGIGRVEAAARWPGGIVPYEISSVFDANDQTKILAGMRRLENTVAINGRLCVRFRPKTSIDTDFISIRTGSGCSSAVGRRTGSQTLTLEKGTYCIDRQ